jgi:hypothetical protein
MEAYIKPHRENGAAMDQLLVRAKAQAERNILPCLCFSCSKRKQGTYSRATLEDSEKPSAIYDDMIKKR